MSHPSARLDDTVHQRVRLGIMAILTEAREADFRYLFAQLGISEGNLSSHLRVLEGAGLVNVRKSFEGRRPRTWVSLTKAGRESFQHELEVLQDLVKRVGAAAARSDGEADGGGRDDPPKTTRSEKPAAP